MTLCSHLNSRRTIAGSFDGAASDVDSIIIVGAYAIGSRFDATSFHIQYGGTFYSDTSAFGLDLGLAANVHSQRIVGEDTSPSRSHLAAGHIKHDALWVRGAATAANKGSIRTIVFD